MTHDTRASKRTQARHLLADLRPQAYSSGPPSRVLDPIVEPLWTGLRVLAAIDVEGVILVDADGDPVAGMRGHRGGSRRRSADVGCGRRRLPDQAGDAQRERRRGVAGRDAVDDRPRRPAAESRDRHPGARRRRRWRPRRSARTTRSASSPPTCSGSTTTSLLDVPLLERERLLEAVLRRVRLVRLGAFVRPPIEAWVGSWRSQGFTGLTFKAANSRYLPGRVPNPDWADHAGCPR